MIGSLARPPRDLQGVVAANAAMGGVKNYGPEDKQMVARSTEQMSALWRTVRQRGLGYQCNG